MTRLTHLAAWLRLLLTDRDHQKETIKWLLRSIAVSGALVALVLPLYGELLLLVWRLVVGVTLLAVVIERVAFDWFPGRRLKGPRVDLPIIPMIVDEGGVPPMRGPLAGSVGPGQGLPQRRRRVARVRQVDPELLEHLRALRPGGETTGADTATEQHMDGDQR